MNAIPTQETLARVDATIQMNRRFRIFSTIEMAGIWISSASGGIAARSPIIVLDAPSCSAKATRNIPLVSVTIAWVASPSLMTTESPLDTSSAVRDSFGTKYAIFGNRPLFHSCAE